MLFDRINQQWQDLVSLPIGYPSWSHDGQYIYFDTTLSEDAAFFRVRISDHKLERLISLKGLRRFWGQLGQWTGLARDDSLLLVRDTSSQEIYALDWQAPSTSNVELRGNLRRVSLAGSTKTWCLSEQRPAR